ncbi:WD40-repeat-containing domain protein [Mycena vulgaris]|nr:WD40-repeat-containing domain protein [Mycena vulgaris]
MSGEGFSILLASIQLLRESSDWFGPLKAAAGGLHAVLLAIGKNAENNEAMKQLGERIGAIAQIVDTYRGKSDVNFEKSLQGLVGFIQKTKADLEALSKRSKFAKIILSDHLEKILAGSSNTLNDIIRDLNLQALLILEQNTDHLISDGALSRLRCPDAFYNSNTVSQRGPCAEGTREIVLEKLGQWVEDDNATGVLMLLGRAGYGKTSIAYSFCQKLEEQERLGASFFCSRTAESTTRVSNILPSYLHCREQFTKLVLPVAGGLIPEKRRPIVVVEGLDECADHKEIAMLVRLLHDAKLHMRFKVLITCRPEQMIRQLIKSKSLKIPDIAIFVREQLVHLVEGRSDFDEPDPWPSDSDVSKVADLAHGMFLVASATCEYICGRGGSIPKRLREVIIAGPTSTRVLERLDRIYRDILENAFILLADNERPAARKVAAITNAFDSLSVATLDQLLDIEEVRSYISSFHSILRIGSGSDPLVGIGHEAFREFISDSSRSKQHWLDRQACHEEILTRCFDLFARLQRNNSVTSAVKDLPQIPVALRYACRHWASHLSIIEHPGTSTLTLLDTFVQHHLLLWLACMSRLEELAHVEKILEDAERWAVAHNMDLLPSFVDARRFTMANFDQLSSSFFVTYPVPCGGVRQTHCFEKTTTSPHRLFSLSYQQTVSSPWHPLPMEKWWRAAHTMGMIQILDPRTLQVSQSVHAHDDYVRSLEFSHDGLLLVSASDDTTAIVWDIGLDKRHKLAGHTDAVLCSVFSSDSGAIITGSADKTIHWWNMSTGSLEKSFCGHDGSVHSVRLTSDDSLLVSASHDSTVRVWNTTTTQSVHILRGHSHPVTSLLLLADNIRTISASDDGSVRLWNISSGKLLETIFGDPLHASSPIDSISLSPDNLNLAVGSKNQMHILNLVHMRCEKTFSGHVDNINTLLFLPGSHHIVSASGDRTLRRWDLRLPSTEHYTARHSATINSLSFSYEGNLLVSASDDCTVRVWDTSTGHCTAIYEQESPISSASFSWNASLVVAESYGHEIRGWDLAAGNLVISLQGNSKPQWSVAASRDGCRAASGSQDGQIQIYDTTNGQVQYSFRAHELGINTLAFSADGTHVVSGSYDHKLKIWSMIDGSLKHELIGHTDWVRDATFSNKGHSVVSGSSDYSVRVWNLAQENHDTLWGHSGRVNSVDISHDDVLVISGDDDGEILVWNLQEKSILRKLTAHETAINSVRFSPDGASVAIVSDGMRIVLWTTENWEAVMVEDGTSGSHCWSVAFSPDGQYVATGSEDGTVRFWLLGTRTFSHEVKLEFPVWKVAFSGSRLLTASDDAVVRAWNIEERSSTTLPGLTLPDGSQLHDGGIKRPIRVDPPAGTISHAASLYSLSDDGRSIINPAGTVCCQIPSAYGDYRVSSWYGSILALGYDSGLVILIKCD